MAQNGKGAAGHGANSGTDQAGKLIGSESKDPSREVNRQPIFVLHLRAERGDGIRDLRSVLKTLLRRHHFRCVAVRQEAS